MQDARAKGSGHSTIEPCNAADAAFSSQPAWGGALRAVCVVAALANGMTIGQRHASHPIPQSLAASPYRLIRGSKTHAE